MLFNDRAGAGRRLAERLRPLRAENPVVLGLPRGGIPVAYQVARELQAPLDVIVVRKLGVPYQPELAFGAIGEGGARVVHEDIVRRGGLAPRDIAAVEESEQAELARRAERYRAGRERVPLTGRTAVVVDDGVATGATAAAACQVARAQGASRVVLAVPVAATGAVDELRSQVDDLVCVFTPAVFFAVGEWYRDFAQTTDEEVTALLRRAAEHPRRPDAPGTPVLPLGEVAVPVDDVRLTGDLRVPEGARLVVMFAHGAGSSRRSPRNRAVADALADAGLGTLLFDLLTPREAADRDNVFDIPLLARRLTGATDWLRGLPGGEHLAVGYFGASTGAAAALTAAAGDPRTAAVVCRGGRPDLTGDDLLARVQAPTLLVVGGADTVVLELNRRAQQSLTCPSRLEIVPGATHLFEEPGALETVAALARGWFTAHPAGTGAP
ncbi:MULTISPECIES: phosphoribosyltransferase family protein [Streptomycetaceae]|uniref:Phosphoribosyltransferase n=1 Tax=Streptantibioticus cattleyicolor (strain ATCC 35852 / DSM 46488 / JCM 4925 / NBRC 14057 / NRRL 8057) TaxID=1003195 RepID=F8K466_STREN|nr:alpha/beta family hydrolase [Streptantibioticus cattleyicolor]AEW92611.1 phosphoribosyltransferase [Streptantibioticus cattleyicolor NRRL 8057 = DSM 46488]MYS57391.1 phosphoribosyltransferase [Streptomyces sp. SID5468]CCB72965.1 Phosphoribosyltransferase [Streptantibioticus cattleyicolor NRRL 8057 = DSM 46488]